MGGGYRDDDAPWRFRGRALYQLNLVKASEARKHVPADLKLVELFGYTLGGVYLARYDDSPAGVFDEMVALGGLVWNPPTSCAWAARVFVNNRDARAHGVKTCGLPSAFAAFDEARGGAETHGWWKDTRPPSLAARVSSFARGGWRRLGKGERRPRPTNETLNLTDDSGAEVCALALPPAGPALGGPRINMRLPSFSGRTDACPDLLKYSLDLRANVRLSPAMVVGELDDEEKVSGAASGGAREGEGGLWAPRGEIRFPAAAAAAASVSLSSSAAAAAIPGEAKAEAEKTAKTGKTPRDEELASILRGKPLLCIAFDSMEMDVGAPVKVAAK